jgi:hypothetical protein
LLRRGNVLTTDFASKETLGCIDRRASDLFPTNLLFFAKKSSCADAGFELNLQYG